MGQTLAITYKLTMEGGTSESFRLRLCPDTLQLITDPTDLPGWTRLEFNQCSNCPLSSAQHAHCPAAVAMADLVSRCEDLVSYDKVDVEVRTEERTVSEHTTAQRAISALMGLMMATSGCPRTAFFRPMARFHLPLANEVETIYRVTSMYLLAQYFHKLEGKSVEEGFSGLTQVYEEMRLVNTAMADRLRASVDTDSPVNAIVLLDLFAQTIPWVINDALAEIRHLFSSHLESDLAAG